uniref:Uncharacterized protein n=1 Tax=Triticum urartu TaxID=4572 RepID=A0A8R7V7N9_TRIUA
MPCWSLGDQNVLVILFPWTIRYVLMSVCALISCMSEKEAVDSRKGIQFQELFGPNVTCQGACLSSGFRVRVGQAQLHFRRFPLLQQGRRRQGDQERRHPEDERGVCRGEDAHPHHHIAI